MRKELVTVSAKGQIVLPSRVRQELGINRGQRLAMTIRSGVILMKPVRRLSQMEGLLKGSHADVQRMIRRMRAEWDAEL